MKARILIPFHGAMKSYWMTDGRFSDKIHCTVNINRPVTDDGIPGGQRTTLAGSCAKEARQVVGRYFIKILKKMTK